MLYTPLPVLKPAAGKNTAPFCSIVAQSVTEVRQRYLPIWQTEVMAFILLYDK